MKMISALNYSSSAIRVNFTKKESGDDSKKEQDKEQGAIQTAEKQDAKTKETIAKLQARDTEVRAHEAAHMAAGGGIAGGASYDYQIGPDGKAYAVGSEVPIDISPESDPKATEAKMQKVRAAALAPASPSPQDIKVAATASMIEMKAKIEDLKEKSEEAKEGVKKAGIRKYEEAQKINDN
jgi:hypothetical protein